MSRLLGIVGLTLLGSAAGAIYVARPLVPDALFCERPVLDLGELRQNQDATGSFKLVNGTRKTIHILRVTESCSCGVTSVSESTLPPSSTSEVTVIWKTGTRRGLTGVELWVDCVSEDGPPLPLKLVLKGNIIPEYDVEPLEPQFEVGGCETQVVRFTPNRTPGITVKSVVCSQRCLSARVLEDSRSVEVTFHKEKWRAARGVQPWVTVTTDSGLVPAVELRCGIKEPSGE